MKIFAPSKPISISLSPNTEKDDIRLALKLIFSPWKWKNGRAGMELESDFKKYLGVKYAFSFNSGRSAFFAILKALEFKPRSQVLLQAFTCNAAAGPILWSGLEPVYVDCNKGDFNIEVEDLEKKIRSESKAVMVQHTLGLPADLDKISKICQNRDLFLIEDCAHSLGAEYEGRKTGTFGKAAFFSFGRDKVISSVYGGMAVTNDDFLGEKLSQLQNSFGRPGYFWIFQQILHPILLNLFVLPLYNLFDIGKIFLVLSQSLRLLSKAVSPREKQGEKPDYFPKALPNALALMAQNQFEKLEKLNRHRQKISDIYYQELKDTELEAPEIFPERKNVFLRFIVRHKNAHKIIYDAWKNKNILLGDWYTWPLAPGDTKLEDFKYVWGSCPCAESLAKSTFNLPTHIKISEKEAKIITDFLKKEL